MTVVDGTLSDRDIARLARMHVEALPQSLVSLVGERYARAFYRYCAASSQELVLIERDGTTLSGGCLVSLAPDTLPSRLLTRTPLLLFAPFALRRLPFSRMLLGAATPAGPAQPRGPELLLIFTLPEARGQGLGARLLTRCEQLLASRGFGKLLVQTRDEPANRALRFYERAGFERIASRIKYGKPLALFEKALAARPN